MSLAVSVATDGVRVPVARARVEALVRGVLKAERVHNAFVSVAFVSPAAIARLNRQHLGHRGPTDVISFAHAGGGAVTIGDIYICPDAVRRNATAWGTGIREELTRVVVHGVLHVLGYDHPDDADERTTSPMWRRQERLVRRLAYRLPPKAA
jgi:probable rRNA maturation factor